MTQSNTPAQVAQEATEHTASNLNHIVLLGTFGPQKALQALVRLPNGRVAQVTKGDRIGRQTVYAIDDARIALGQNGRAQLVAIPGH